MAKHKSQRALYELLFKQRSQEKAKPDGGLKPSPVVRRPYGGEAKEPPRMGETLRRETPAPLPRVAVPPALSRAPVVIGGVALTYGHLLIAGVVVVCLCVLCYLLGTRGRNDLPVTEKHPTMAEIRGGPVIPGLVKPGPTPPGGTVTPAPGGNVRVTGTATPRGAVRVGGVTITPPGKTEKAEGGEEPKTVSGPQFRVRIQRLDVSQPDAVDRLRAFLVQNGIETELETRGGYHLLYSRDRFSDKKKSDELAAKVNKALDAFEKATRRPTSKDAYTILITKE